MDFSDLIPKNPGASSGLSFDDLIPKAKTGEGPSLAPSSVGLSQGVTLGFGDEIMAGAFTPVEMAVGAFNGADSGKGLGQRLSDAYGRALGRERGLIKKAEEAPGIGYTTGNVAGSLLSGGPAMKLVNASSLTGRLTQSGLVSGGLSGVHGFGSGEGLDDRIDKAKTGAAFGTAAGVAGEAAASTLGALVRGTFGGARPSAGVNAAERIAQADEFGVPLSRGQATGDIKQQAFEQAARHEARGEAAGKVMRGFDERQGDAISAAQQGVSARLGGQALPSDEMGASVAQGLKARAEGFRSSANDAYKSAASKEALIGTDEVSRLGHSVGQRLEAAGINLDTYGNYPGSQSAMNILKRVSGFERQPSAAGVMAGAGDDVQVVAQSLSGIEQARKALLKVKPANAEDARALKEIRGSFDEWLDDAVNQKLFSGDPTALADLKTARNLWSQYKGMTNGKTDSTKIIAKIVNEERTGQEVASWLLNASNSGMAGRAQRVALEVKKHLGPNSPEWEALRQAAWSQMTSPKTGQGPQAVSTSVNKFLTGEGAPLAKALFSADEIGQMQKLAGVMKMTVADPKATNPSKSGYEIMRSLAGTASPTVAGAAAAWGTGDPKYLMIAAAPLLRNAGTMSKAIAATHALPSNVGPMATQAMRGAIASGAGTYPQLGGQR